MIIDIFLEHALVVPGTLFPTPCIDGPAMVAMRLHACGRNGHMKPSSPPVRAADSRCHKPTLDEGGLHA